MSFLTKIYSVLRSNECPVFTTKEEFSAWFGSLPKQGNDLVMIVTKKDFEFMNYYVGIEAKTYAINIFKEDIDIGLINENVKKMYDAAK